MTTLYALNEYQDGDPEMSGAIAVFDDWGKAKAAQARAESEWPDHHYNIATLDLNDDITART